MTHADQIQVHDIVHVDFNNAQFTLCSQAEVLALPFATGDSWIFKDVASGDIHYVSGGCTVTKTAATPEPKQPHEH